MGRLIRMTRGYYRNKDAIENAIRYITRTRRDEPDKDSLLYYSAVGVDQNRPEFMIYQFEKVQEVFKGRYTPGRKVFHEVFSLYDEDMQKIGYNMAILYKFAARCAEFYYNRGFQVVYAVHNNINPMYDFGVFHIHFVGNAVSYADGRKWHSSNIDSEARNRLFNEILAEYYITDAI